MEAKILEYALNHPGQISNSVVVLLLLVFSKWFIKQLRSTFDSLERALKALEMRVTASEGNIKDNTHLLVGVKGDNGLNSKVRSNTQRLNSHADKLSEHDREIGQIKTRLGDNHHTGN